MIETSWRLQMPFPCFLNTGLDLLGRGTNKKTLLRRSSTSAVSRRVIELFCLPPPKRAIQAAPIFNLMNFDIGSAQKRAWAGGGKKARQLFGSQQTWSSAGEEFFLSVPLPKRSRHLETPLCLKHFSGPPRSSARKLHGLEHRHRLYRARQPVSTATIPPEMRHLQPVISCTTLCFSGQGPPWLD